MVMRNKTEDIGDKMHLRVYRFNVRFTAAMFGVMGILAIADGTAYLIFGHSLFGKHMIM